MKKTKKKNNRMIAGAAGVLLAATLILQGCNQINPEDKDAKTDESSGSQGAPSYIYPTMNYQYKTDISQVEQYILTGMDGKYLLLANKKSVLDADYVPDHIVNLTCKTNPDNSGRTEKLENRAAIALYAMLAEMAADGVTDIFVTSSYREYSRQMSLYNSYIDKEMRNNPNLSRAEAEQIVLTYSAKPGTSEHQTGLCIDFGTDYERGTVGEVVTEAFENTDAFRWLSQNAYRFGFILRYPKDKVDITGYSYEPWHYRFVGREAATEIYFHGQCLEEFLGAEG